jgi:KAP family P-loop domain
MESTGHPPWEPIRDQPPEAVRDYVLLNDQPVDSGLGDLLGTGELAGGIASVLVASRSSSPFVLTIDAGWGMGKSTLLRQIESCLPRRSDIVKVRFNAWTAEGENALEELIKTVLGELDPNTVRRWVRKLGRLQQLRLATRLGLGLVARFFGMARLVDEFWTRLGDYSKSRNEMRDLIRGMLSDWITQGSKDYSGRALLIFVDDLDRCPDDVVVKVCEAVKLYLDVPGLIFVMACDQSVLARGVSSARGDTSQGRMYLEKIVQVVYRVPFPEVEQVRRLIRGYARLSGTTNLIDQNVAEILAEGTGRNPRKIKRIINSFVLEYGLDPAWRKPPLGSAQLVRAVLLQHLYPLFYELLIREDIGEDPIGMFLDYAHVRERVVEPPTDNPDDPWWDTMRRIFQACRLVPRFPTETAESEIKRLETELPEAFQVLARNHACVTLLRGIGDSDSRRSLHAQLIHRPLATAQVPAPQLLPVTVGQHGSTLPLLATGEASHDGDAAKVVPTSLADAVEAAYAEGKGFGESVARDTSKFRLEAILARMPSMPSDLEVKLLRGSALSVDWLLGDGVRDALYRGFWDALKEIVHAHRSGIWGS